MEVKNLRKTYKNFEIKHLSFVVKPNRIVGFIGVNGSGKTTTIKSILQLIRKDEGDIIFFGEHFSGNEIEIKDKIGVVLDEGCFYETLTMKQMKKIVSSAYKHWSEEAYNNYMRQFKLDEKQKIKTLSKGMKMKYALALALSHNAKILIMDEPSSGLDPLVRNELMDLLKAFVSTEGNSVFYSTHITSDLDKIADDIIFINNGEIIFSEEKNCLKDKYLLVEGDTSRINTKSFINFNYIAHNTVRGIIKNEPNINIDTKLLVDKPTIEDIMLCLVKE